jgi:MinD-like ATPase involved in chromosome partitioning or flagellar assembly
VQLPLRGCYRIALLSLKGGVGKTTITATLGATFASIRGDRVVAVDANPDRGTLSQKVPLETPATVRHLLRDAEGIEAYSDVRSYTSQGPSRLEVLASESDPAVSEAFSSDDYTRTLEVLERFYSLVLTDCGTGMLHSAMSAVLDKADVLVVISSGSVDGARSASATLDWLDAHGHQEMVRNSIAVINAVRPRSGKVDMKKVVDHFARRCRAVKQVPFDPHLEEGAEISLDRLKPATREALIELAAVVADGFSDAQRPDAQSD